MATVAALLRDGSAFLAGDRPSLADFSAYHTAWWLERRPRVGWVFDEFPEIGAWTERLAAFGHGEPRTLSAEAALAVARRSEPDVREVVDALDPAGRRPGDWVRVAADDYGQDAVEGRLVALRADAISIVRSDPEAGHIVNHFPRIGFRLLGAEKDDTTPGMALDARPL
jgi:hypothetical protein